MENLAIDYDEIKHKTPKATLFIIEGGEYWIPESQIVALDEDELEVCLTGYIAKEKGLF